MPPEADTIRRKAGSLECVRRATKDDTSSRQSVPSSICIYMCVSEDAGFSKRPGRNYRVDDSCYEHI